MADEEKHLRVSKKTHKRIMKKKYEEEYESVDQIIRDLLDQEEG